MATLHDHDLTTLWKELEPNKRTRALVVARILSKRGTDEQKATYANKISQETYFCTERDEALRILNQKTGNSWLAALVEVEKEQPPVIPIRMDVETARLAIALHKVGEFRMWCIARELTRQGNGDGKTTKTDLYDALARFGVSYSRDHFSRLLRHGTGLFWRIDPETKIIYMNSPQQVAPALVDLAYQCNPLLVATNRPGGRDMYVSVSHSHEAFEANIYAGWMSHREHPTISREVLEILFDRSADTLRRWEQDRLDGMVTVRENYAQYEPDPNTWEQFIPDHAQPYLAHAKRDGVYTQAIRYRWQIPNTYHTMAIKQHPHRGQNRKVSNLVNTLLDQYGGFPVPDQKSGQPALSIGRGYEKRYFHDPKKLKRYVQKTGCDERLLWRGQDKQGRGVFEPTLSYGHTRPNERASFTQEYRYFKTLHQRIHTYVTQHAVA